MSYGICMDELEEITADEKGRTLIRFMYRKGDPAVPVLLDEVRRLGSLNLSIQDVARAYISERAELVRSGWGLNQPQLAKTLELLIPKDSGAQTWPLRVARSTLRDRLSNPNLTDEEAHQILKEQEILPKALKAGVKLYSAGLDLNDSALLDTLAATIQSPAILKFLKALVQADEKQIKKVLSVVDKTIKSNG